MDHNLQLPFRLKDSTLIVFEGLDATGKSTVMESFEQSCIGATESGTPMFTPEPMFTHSPSGHTELGDTIYRFTEDNDIASPLARQFLHLASHAEEWQEFIFPALDEGRSVFMDRWWWSTVAYGWWGNPSLRRQISMDDFAYIARWPTIPAGKADPLTPSIVFLFLDPWNDDRHNTSDVRDGYEWLADTFASDHPVVPIHKGNRAQVKLQIFDALAQHGLYYNEPVEA